jgi:hypothetical protein
MDRGKGSLQQVGSRTARGEGNAAVYLLGKAEAPSKATATRHRCAHWGDIIALLRAHS